MLTKKLKFSDDVLTIIKGMTWEDGGKLGKLPPGQLSRELYLKVNKALTKMGGKWNRKLAGHVFRLDPRKQVSGLIDNGFMTVKRDGFFETPLPVIRRMIELVTPRGSTLEPSAGLGAIALNLGVPKSQIFCIELNQQRVDELNRLGFNAICQDFREYGAETFDTIFMNPPFEELQDIAHVRHAYSLLNDGGELVSVMSESPFFRDDRRAVIFREWLAAMGGYVEKLPAGSFKASGTGVNTRLVVISKNGS